MSGSVTEPVSVVILTFNEELNLPDCLESTAGWAADVFVVDSGSSDRTCEIARSHGARVFSHPFETHSAQWSWALENLPLRTDWILGLDADQRVTPELANELRDMTAGQVGNAAGGYIKRRQVFHQRWIRHGGYYPKYLLKLFRKSAVQIDLKDLVDHHFQVAGPTIKLQGDLIELNLKEDDISFWIEKHNRYATLLAREELAARAMPRPRLNAASFRGTPDERIAQFKNLWRRLPLYVRPFLYFFYRYFLLLGFLDGKEGAIFHFLQAFWFRLLVDIKLDSMQREATRS